MSRKAWLAGLLPAAAAAVALGSIVANRKAPPPISAALAPVRVALASAARSVPATPAPIAMAAVAPQPVDVTTHTPADRAAGKHPDLKNLIARMHEKMTEAAVNPSGAKEIGEEHLIQEGHGWDQWFFSQRVYPGKTLPLAATETARTSAASNNGFQGRNGRLPSALPKWESIGPTTLPKGQTDTSSGHPRTNVSGRVAAIAVDSSSDPSVVYVGGAQGGVWKSTNATYPNATWTPLTDKEASLAVGSIAIDPNNSNTIYVGTGEPNQSCDSYYGHGILKSTDGGVTWLQINPMTLVGFAFPPFDGRAVDTIVVNPANSNIVYAATQVAFLSSGTTACQIANTASPRGGLYVSIDAGIHWLPDLIFGLTSLQYNVTDIVLDPSDGTGRTLYVGVADSSNLAQGIDTGPNSNNGIYKTTNGGTSWTHLGSGLPDPGANIIARINLSIGPTSGGTKIYAVYTDGFTTQLGLYSSTDGGATWANSDDTNNSVVGGNNVNIAANGDVTELGVGGNFVSDGSWTGRRFVWDPSGVGTNIRVNVITAVSDSSHLKITPPIDASAHPNSAWSVGSYPGYCDGQCSYDMTIATDPNDVNGNTIYIGGNPHYYQNFNHDPNRGTHYVWRSTDGGNTWIGISQGSHTTGGIHTDDHVIAFDPSTGYPSVIYDGNDGGAWSSTDRGADWLDLNTNLTITQFQGISTHPSNPDILIGGTQDNGTELLDEAGTGVVAPAWYHTQDGDGGQTLIDQQNPNRMFHTFFSESEDAIGPEKALDGAVNGPFVNNAHPGSWQFVGGYDSALFYGAPDYSYYAPYTANGIDMSDPVQFYLPIAQNEAAGQFAPSKPNSKSHGPVLANPPSVIYLGTNKLYRSPDPTPWYYQFPSYGGYPPAWTPKSPPLTNPSDSFDALMAIGVYPQLIGGEEIVYTGSFDGLIYVTKTLDGTPGPASWIRLDNTGSGSLPPSRSVTQIVTDPRDVTGQSAFVTFSGFNANSATPGHVFKVTNSFGTPIWSDLSGDLPDLPTNAITFDEINDIIYVANDIGVFESLDDGSHYNYLNEGMPNVSVFGLERNPTTGEVVASTHGRGAFQLIANGAYDSTPPVCQPGSYSTSDPYGTAIYLGEASDSGPNDTGISTIAMDSGATNLMVTNKDFTSPQHATYEVDLIEPCLPGSGYVIVTDFGGNTCEVYVNLPANPVLTEDLGISMGDDTWNGLFDLWNNPEFIGEGFDVTAGNALDYTLCVTNNGPAEAGDVVVTDTLPPAGFVSATWYPNLWDLHHNTSGTPCNVTGNPISCDLGDMTNGEKSYVYISIVPNVPAGTEITNTASVSDAGPLNVGSCDPNTANNTATDSNQIDASNLAPSALTIDDSSGGNGNGVIEPGESFVIEPAWQNNGTAPNAFTGTASSWIGPIDLLVNMYDLTDTAAGYGDVLPGNGANAQAPPLDISDCTQTTAGCYAATLNPPSQRRPVIHWDTVLTENLSDGTTKAWVLHIGNSFSDVPVSDEYYTYIETMFHNNITLGCSSTPDSNGQGMFCGSSTLDRESMAAFIAREIAGGDFNVPFSEGSGPHPYDCNSGPSNFGDVPVGSSFCRHINYIYNRLITTGCGSGDFCPTAPLLREEMAPFIARLRAGSDAAVDATEATGPHPYDCTSSSPSDWPFSDVPNTNVFCKYIGYLHNAGVVNGYGNGTFGPTDTLTREQSSAFMVKGLDMKLYKP